MTLLNNSVIKRLGIFCFYDKNGHAARFLDGFLAALTQKFDGSCHHCERENR